MDRPDRGKILYEICCCCIHKPLEIYEGLFRDSPKTYAGSGCYEGYEEYSGKYCQIAIKSANAILALIPDVDKVEVTKYYAEMMKKAIDRLRDKKDAEIKQARADTTIAVESTMEAQCDAKIAEIFKAYDSYVKALEDENGSLIGLAYIHGWRSSGVKLGMKCRAKIKALKSRFGGKK